MINHSPPVPEPDAASDSSSAEGDYYPALVASRREALAQQIGAISFPDAHFVWELGSGHGHFLTAFAQARPERVYLGIDIIGERVERANRKRDRAKLPQLHFLHAEARLFLETLPPALAISDVFVLFPDPWPKKRHHKHRIIQPAFLSLVRTRMRAGARLFFRTDHQGYFDHARATLLRHPDWQLVETPWPFEHQSVFQQRSETYFSLAAEPRP